jgi:NAD+ diphosphatase
VVVITLVTAGEACLLGRQPRFAPDLFSSFAGFVEPGETVEDAARREVREEAGLELQSLAYAFSQPWPFPSSITLAFMGVAADRSARAGSEMAEVRWFSLAEARQMLSRADAGAKEGLRIPGPMTLGNQLVRRWVGELSAAPDRLPAG